MDRPALLNAWPNRRSVTFEFCGRGTAPRNGVFVATLHATGGKSAVAKSSRGVCALTALHRCALHSTVAIFAQGTLWADANLQAFCVFGNVLQGCCFFLLICQRCLRGPMLQPLDDEIKSCRRRQLLCSASLFEETARTPHPTLRLTASRSNQLSYGSRCLSAHCKVRRRTIE